MARVNRQCSSHIRDFDSEPEIVNPAGEELTPITTQGAIVVPVVNPRQNGSISHTEVLHTVNPQFAVDHGHGIAAHSCGARLMPEGTKPVTKETLQLRPAERVPLAPGEGPQDSGVADVCIPSQEE